jgi:uncharacterized protein YndB with AHSA1/START domain
MTDMNILLTIVFIIVGLIVLLLLIALFIKKEYKVEREMVINRPRSNVYDYARMLKNQEKYSVWVMRDPKVQIVYTGTDGTPGAMSAWKSDNKNVGIGEQEIKKIHEGESIEVEIRFKKPFESTGYGTTLLSDAGPGNTKIVSRFSGVSKYPFNLMNIMLDKMLGKDMLQNLSNMKNNLEKQ